MFGRLLCLFSVSVVLSVDAQQRSVSFLANDSIEIFADLFLAKPERPYVILFHQDNSSRGEYRDIAPRLLNLDYNCLAVDLRVGSEINFIKNKTIIEVREKYTFSDCLADILASIDFAFSKNNQPVILFGSGFSASLALIAAKNNNKVQAVIAFSPGEYLRPTIKTQDRLENFDKKNFVGVTSAELPYVKELMQPVANSLKTFSCYDSPEGFRGGKLLWEDNQSSDKFWLDLLLFFKGLAQ